MAGETFEVENFLIRTYHSCTRQQRVLYKQALITFNILRHNNPSYLRDLLTIHNPSHNLRSSSHHLLSVGYMRIANCFIFALLQTLCRY